MSDFSKFSKAVANQFEKIQKKDLLYQTYLDSFPEGTNPIFRERTLHDCP